MSQQRKRSRDTTPDSGFHISVGDALRLIGRHAQTLDAKTRRDALEPDLSLSEDGKVSFESIHFTAVTGEWPHKDILESIAWVLGETISGLPEKRANDPMAAPYATYLAILLLHCETVLGERGIPSSPSCTAVVCRGAVTLHNSQWTSAVLACLVNELAERQAKHKSQYDLTMLRVAVGFLLRLLGAQMIGFHCDAATPDLERPWLWMDLTDRPESKPGSFRLWQEIFAFETQTSEAIKDLSNRWQM